MDSTFSICPEIVVSLTVYHTRQNLAPHHSAHPGIFEKAGKKKNTCRTSLRGVNGSGLWIFTREPTPSREVVEEARAAARDLGIDLSEMRAVTHEGCEYPDA